MLTELLKSKARNEQHEQITATKYVQVSILPGVAECYHGESIPRQRANYIIVLCLWNIFSYTNVMTVTDVTDVTDVTEMMEMIDMKTVMTVMDKHTT